MKGENPVRVRILELAANGEKVALPGVPKGTLHYHLEYLREHGFLDRKGGLTPRGMAYYLNLLQRGIAVGPKRADMKLGVWLNGLWAHALSSTILLLLYSLLGKGAMFIFHFTKGGFLLSLASFLLYACAIFGVSSWRAKMPFFPASYLGLLPVASAAFLPLEGAYRLVYALAQASSVLLCSEALHLATRMGRYRTLALNLGIYLLGLTLYW